MIILAYDGPSRLTFSISDVSAQPLFAVQFNHISLFMLWHRPSFRSETHDKNYCTTDADSTSSIQFWILFHVVKIPYDYFNSMFFFFS